MVSDLKLLFKLFFFLNIVNFFSKTMYVIKGIDYYLFNHGCINYQRNTFLVRFFLFLSTTFYDITFGSLLL